MSSVSIGSVNGIPRFDLRTRPIWKRRLGWWAGGQVFSTKAGGTVWRNTVARIEGPVIKATRGRVKFGMLPIVVLTSIGARSGARREVPLAYFTEGDDVVLIASNFAQERHPGWYHNLRAHPECELHIGPRGGVFVAHEAEGADRDRLFELAIDRLNQGWAIYEQRVKGIRTIPVMRLTPAQSR